ncbi:MAG TPA: CpsB/CapC family capsule biosynthesis tyrosine phosphatase [Phnomibacter sp.]|nr:CpsB/CapC family capsule biosynthesis tyrosine phosphatase [Phnomibacter sp.]
MFSFFKKKSQQPNDSLAFIGTDMHNHLLPGIDDGSPDLDTSLQLMEGLMQLGYHSFYCTPHVLGEVHPNTPETIGAAFQVLQSAVVADNIPVKLGYSAEYMVDYDVEDIIKTGKLVALPGNRILIEMSYAVDSPNIKEVIFQLQTKGYSPILAHPERYPYYYNRFSVYESFLDAGADLQLNILSLTGYYGSETKRIAEKILQADFYNWIGTDLHHFRHLAAIQNLAGTSKIVKQLERIKNLKNNQL